MQYQVPVLQLPHIQSFFPDLKTTRTNSKKLCQIDEMMNESELLPVRERTNSDNFANKITSGIISEIEHELSKPS